MDKNTLIANTVTIGGITICLAIAQLPILLSTGILTATVIGCVHLTKKENK